MDKKLAIKEYQQIIIDFAVENDLVPELMLSSAQTALLNIVDRICECFEYTNEEHKQCMIDYANSVVVAVNKRIGKE